MQQLRPSTTDYWRYQSAAFRQWSKIPLDICGRRRVVPRWREKCREFSHNFITPDGNNKKIQRPIGCRLYRHNRWWCDVHSAVKDGLIVCCVSDRVALRKKRGSRAIPHRKRKKITKEKTSRRKNRERERELWLCESARQTINNGLCELGRHPDNEPVTDGCPSYIYHDSHYIRTGIYTHCTYVYMHTCVCMM